MCMYQHVTCKDLLVVFYHPRKKGLKSKRLINKFTRYIKRIEIRRKDRPGKGNFTRTEKQTNEKGKKFNLI